jgi:NADPH-dependent 2,4-dienoyl-CoA reductase/sulfur reductase-like enzyme
VLHYRYLIVGGGMTADAAVRGIREVDPATPIGLIGAETDPPYKRPPLTKGLWHGKPLDRVWCRTDDLGVDLHLGRTVRYLDLHAKHAVDDRGTSYAFDRLLLATGGRPRRLPLGGHRIVYYRTLDDYRRLRALVDQGERFAVVGGGFIGAEIAAALASQGKAVTMIFPEGALGARIFPADLARFLTDHYRAQGVEVLTGATLTGLEPRGERSSLQVGIAEPAEDRRLLVDGVVAGVGIQPNVELAAAAGLTVADGITVDELLRTDHPDVYAAGDVAGVPIAALSDRRRIEHEDHARATGRLAGRAMAGEPEPYRHLPFFYSDLFDLGYEAVGEIDARLQTVVDWDEPYRKGVVRYLRDDRLRGVLLWNVWDRVEEARRLIADAGIRRPADADRRLVVV